MHARQWALLIGSLAVAAGAATSLAVPLELTPQHVAVLGVCSAVLAFLQTQLPTAGVTDRRAPRKADPPTHG